MYRTYGKWTSANNTFRTITGYLTKKIVNLDSDLTIIETIINKNLEGNFKNYSVSTEAEWKGVFKDYRIYIDEYKSDLTNGKSTHIMWFLQRRAYFGFKHESYGEYVCFQYNNCDTGEKKKSIYEIKNGEIVKNATVSFKDNVLGKEEICFDLEGNILTQKNDNPMASDIDHTMAGDETDQRGSNMEHELKEKLLIKK
jgi:hypothetical protein